jgi:DNA-binding CsgD family transcriptional regulator
VNPTQERVIQHTGTPLLERDRELHELGGLADEACSGTGRLVLLEGPPGIGKTRLLDAGRLLARERGMTVLSARASELDREFPFGVARQLFEPPVAHADEARRAALLRGAAGPAASLLAHGFSELGLTASGTDPALAHFHALYWLTANLAEERPLALAIDDLHWADASSLRFLQFLLPRLGELPVLLLVAARPLESQADGGPIDSLATDPLAVVVRPEPLSRRAVAAVIATELGEAADDRFSEACRQATGGNPFLLRELLRELAAEGVGPHAARVGLVRELAPATVARAVLLRLARLDTGAAALARAVAVLGDGAPLRRASALAGLSSDRAGELAGALAQADILATTRPLAFAHPILRSAVYGDIDAAERARAHGRAATLLAEEGAEVDAIAVHLLATEPSGDHAVAGQLREAAERALARGAAATAVACLRRALAEPPAVADRGSLLLDLAFAELRAGEPAGAADHFDEGMRITRDPRLRAAFAWDQAVALQALGRHDEAFAVRERVVEELADIDAERALLLEASLIASARLDLSRLEWARLRLERHRGRLSVETRAEARLLATQAHLDAFSPENREPAEALADVAEAALASGHLLEGDTGLSTPFFAAIEVLLLADRVEPARQALDQVVDEARRRGSAPSFVFGSGWRCQLLAREGALADAEADARSCAELSLAQGWFVAGPLILGYALDVLVDRGELADAERLLDASGMAGRPPDRDLAFDPVVHARARLRAARGDLAGGRADLAGLERRKARWNTFPTLVPAVLAAPKLASGDPDVARAGAERMLRDARVWGTPRAIGMALRAAGLAEGGARGLELLDEAATVLEPSPAPLEHAGALTDLGAALRRANRRKAARDPLRRALDVADGCGARPLAERARHELRAAGGRPRRARNSGVPSLTASERRIATMAADGLSNPEIAQALFITKKTVESHLGNVFGKLDIRSRTQLPAALRDDTA